MSYTFRTDDWGGFRFEEGRDLSRSHRDAQFAITSPDPEGFIEFAQEHGLARRGELNIGVVGTGTVGDTSESSDDEWIRIGHKRLLDGLVPMIGTNYDKPSHQETMSDNLHNVLFGAAVRERMDQNSSWLGTGSKPRKAAVAGLAMLGIAVGGSVLHQVGDTAIGLSEFDVGALGDIGFGIAAAGSGAMMGKRFKGWIDKAHTLQGQTDRYARWHAKELAAFKEGARGLIGVEFAGQNALQIAEEYAGAPSELGHVDVPPAELDYDVAPFSAVSYTIA